VVAPAYEQLVLERVTQAGERVADGRLAQADRLAGAGGAALAHQRIEDAQEIEIEGCKIHIRDAPHINIQFPARGRRGLSFAVHLWGARQGAVRPMVEKRYRAVCRRATRGGHLPHAPTMHAPMKPAFKPQD
jgi:hypothetical protein